MNTFEISLFPFGVFRFPFWAVSLFIISHFVLFVKSFICKLFMNFMRFSSTFWQSTYLLYHIQAILSSVCFVNSLWTLELPFFRLMRYFVRFIVLVRPKTACLLRFSRLLSSDSLIIISPFLSLVNLFCASFLSLDKQTKFVLVFCWICSLFSISNHLILYACVG